MLGAVAIALVLAGATTAAQQRDISGTWELWLDGRRVPAAKLVAGVTRATLDDIAAKDARSVPFVLPKEVLPNQPPSPATGEGM